MEIPFDSLLRDLFGSHTSRMHNFTNMLFYKLFQLFPMKSSSNEKRVKRKQPNTKQPKKLKRRTKTLKRKEHIPNPKPKALPLGFCFPCPKQAPPMDDDSVDDDSLSTIGSVGHPHLCQRPCVPWFCFDFFEFSKGFMWFSRDF